MKISASELAYWLALQRMEGIGPARFKQILQKYASISEYFYCHPLEKSKIDQRLVDKDLEWSTSPHCHILTFVEDTYPRQLKEIHAFPPILFVQGDPNILLQPQIGIVGSRNPSIGGRDNARQFSKTFSQTGLIVTSGFAAGIDAASHEGALENGKTIAIMGTGPDVIYPKHHVSLAKRIIEQGCLVTEFPLGTLAFAQNFPRRNRLISGLSLGILVVEAAFASGSLITARYALEQNKEVFAIPGSIHSPLSKGCHALIQQGAKLVETAQDVLEELHFSAPQEKLTESMAEDPFLSYIGDESTPIDLIIQKSDLTAEKVSSILLMLELKGLIASVPGGYIRLR